MQSRVAVIFLKKKYKLESNVMSLFRPVESACFAVPPERDDDDEFEVERDEPIQAS